MNLTTELTNKGDFLIELTGKQFNDTYKGPFVKLTTFDENHNGQLIVTGENKDSNPWFPYFTCFPGKIYFIHEDDIYLWITYNNKCSTYLRYVTIDDDAQVYVEHIDGYTKFGADRLILSERHDLHKFIMTNVLTMTRIFKYVREHTTYYLSDQKDSLNSVTYGILYDLTRIKSLELCIKCIKSKMITLDQVPITHRETCVMTLTKEKSNLINLNTILYCFDQIINPTRITYWNLVKLVLQNDKEWISAVTHTKAYDLSCRPFINRLWDQLEQKTMDLQVVKECIVTGSNYLKDDSYESITKQFWTMIINVLIKKSNEVLDFVPYYYDFARISESVIKNNWRTIKYKDDPTRLECYYAISQSYEAISLIKNPRIEFCEFAIRQDWRAIKLIDRNRITTRMWTLAILQNDDAIDELIYEV
jgi:hypothetical protein